MLKLRGILLWRKGHQNYTSWQWQPAPHDPNPPIALEDAAGGGATITADLAATEAQDVAAFVAVRLSVGTLAATEGQDVASFAATLAHTAALAALEAQDVAAFSGALVHVADLAATEAPDVLAFAATLIPAVQTITADLAATEAPDIAAFDATVERVEEPAHPGGKSDNERGKKRITLKARSIVKPTGLTHKPLVEALGKSAPAETLEPAEQRALGGAASDDAAASEFLESLREAPFARTPIAQMSLADIDREIGELLSKKLRSEEEALMLSALLALLAAVV